ncbi:MAG: hypothetical protein LUE98_09285, partial [Tannerellaceae bacterium]|nr:hypothetical protein [Tannerellaceae bacterium]
MNKTILITLILLISLFLACNRDKKQTELPLSWYITDSIIKSEFEHPVNKSLLIEIKKIKEEVNPEDDYISFFYVSIKQEKGIDYLHIAPDINLPIEANYNSYKIIKYN